MITLRIGLSCLFILLAGCHATPPPTTHPRPRIQIQGHRGCRGLRPENTMAAFRHAIHLGVDVLELDLGLTLDGVLVVTHDVEVNPKHCRGVDHLPARRIRALTYAQLQTLDCGAIANPRFPLQETRPGAKMPRLEQVLDLLLQHPVGANIEIKTSPDHPQATWPPERFAQALIPLLRARKLERRVTIQSFDPRALVAVARLSKGTLKLVALADRRAAFEPMLQATGASTLSPRHTVLRRSDIVALHRRAIRVIPWTVNSPSRMRELIRWGVDGIITDRPDLLLHLVHNPKNLPLPNTPKI